MSHFNVQVLDTGLVQDFELPPFDVQPMAHRAGRLLLGIAHVPARPAEPVAAAHLPNLLRVQLLPQLLNLIERLTVHHTEVSVALRHGTRIGPYVRAAGNHAALVLLKDVAHRLAAIPLVICLTPDSSFPPPDVEVKSFSDPLYFFLGGEHRAG